MKDLLTFVKTRRREGDFGRFVPDVGDKEDFFARSGLDAGDFVTWVIAVNLLDWLKEQKRLGNEEEWILNPESTWCRSVPTLLATDASLSRLFECVEGRVRFKADVPAEERNCIRDLADAEYQPEVKP
jgi:hypothetical protein